MYVTSHEMCVTAEIWEVCRHVSWPKLHARSRDVSRVTEVWICAIDLNAKSPLTSQLHALTSHELTWREDSVSPALVGWVSKLSVHRSESLVVGELVCKMIPNSSLSFLCCMVLIIVWFVLNVLIHVYYLDAFFLLWRCDPTRVMASTFLRFLDHTQRRTTVGRTPLDEWSARRRDLYLTTHNTHNRQISMPPVGFEQTISAGERPQTYALDRAATGTGI